MSSPAILRHGGDPSAKTFELIRSARFRESALHPPVRTGVDEIVFSGAFFAANKLRFSLETSAVNGASCSTRLAWTPRRRRERLPHARFVA